MAVKEVVIWPDPVLKRRAEDVDLSTLDADFQTFLDDMVETMYAEDGLGLAAPQVGVSQRIFVVDVPISDDEEDEGARTGPLFFINPEFVETEGEVLFEEGCLSLPGLTVEMKRHARVRVRAFDRHGKAFEVDVDGLYAIALQHEQDHLDGRLLVEHLSPLKKQLFRKKMLKLKEERAEEREDDAAHAG